MLPGYEGKDPTYHRQHIPMWEKLKTIMERRKATDSLLKHVSLKGLEETWPFQQEDLTGYGTEVKQG